MKRKDIKVGTWYEAKQGIGKCLATGRILGENLAELEIVVPEPHRVTISPRDVERVCTRCVYVDEKTDRRCLGAPDHAGRHVFVKGAEGAEVSQ